MAETNKKEAVTVLGLGAMGKALAKAFLHADHKTTVWNRSSGKANELIAAGAKNSGLLPEAIAASSLIIICLLNYDAVYNILENLKDDSLRGRTVVNLTNGTPGQAREMASFIESKGGKAYLDGGIMAVPSLIGRKDIFILYSGSSFSYEKHRNTLQALGEAKFLGTDAGLASLHDLALLSGMYSMFGGFLQAIALLDSEHIPAKEFTASLFIPWLQAMMTTLPEMALQIDKGNYASQEASLAMQVSGGSLIDFSISQGVRPDLLVPIELLMKQRVANGYGEDDFASTIELIKKSAKH
ncbi:NAD(P)-dependent oxidoreductase [Olivibacter sp. SDN3]|uniref:NAD(P)-dependent oxidoreductase n=1 Tax=Olivibacter sp. SDN3 TaxID=2764720 RepID=UPI0016512932|nr:NAD(P)-binding domain-containing protein [Olivibacter sp. SDN3]QNL51020.1 NAD(P)-dependent oxidoreductase [Olivibacter sp. SDN3]